MRKDYEMFVVSSARRGDERAWHELFEAHVDCVYQYCLGLAGGAPDHAEEVTQQVFMTAARQIRRFVPQRGTFRAWLLGIARNRHMTLAAAEQRRRQHEGRVSQERRPTNVRVEYHLRVHEALSRLPHRYRQILEAKYLKGMAMKEIAEIEGVTVEATESLLRRARNRFAQVYEGGQQ
jgi:RNA polymerase sigma-70 factor (ECF subfamily)